MTHVDDGIADVKEEVRQPKSSRVQTLRVGAAAQMLPLVAGYGVNLLATPYVVVRLGLHDFGVWSITGAMAQYLALFDLGVSRAANRYVALYHARGETKNERAVVGVCVAAVVGLGCLLFAIALLVPGLLDHVLRTGDSQLAQYLMITAISILTCGLLGKALAAASIGRGRQVSANMGIALSQVAQVVGGVAWLIHDPSLRSFAMGTAVGAALGLGAVVAIILYDERRIVVGWPQAAVAREILAFGMKGQVLGAADIVFYQSGKVIAGIVVGPAAAGAYELGLRLVRGVQTFGSAASVALTTHLTRAYAVGEHAAIVADYARLTRRNAAVAMFPPLLLAATAPSAVPLWLGERQDGVLVLVAALTPGIAISVSTGVCIASLMAMGRSGIVAAVSVVSVTGAIGLALGLSHTFGYVGIVAALGFWLVVGDLLGIWFLHTRIAIPMATFLRALGGPVALGAAAVAVALPINYVAAPDDRASAVLPFVISGAVFCAIYLAAGWRCDFLPRLRGGSAVRGVRRAGVTTATASEAQA